MWLSDISVLRTAVERASGSPAAYRHACKVVTASHAGSMARHVAVFDLDGGLQCFAWLEPSRDDDLVVVVVEGSDDILTPEAAVRYSQPDLRLIN